MAKATRNAAGTKIFILFDARARSGEYTFNENGEADNETPRFDIPA